MFMAGCDGWMAGCTLQECVFGTLLLIYYLHFSFSFLFNSIQFIRFNSFGRAGGGGPSFIDHDDDDTYIHIYILNEAQK